MPWAAGFLQRSRLRLDRARHCSVRPDATFGKGMTLQLRIVTTWRNTVIDDAVAVELFQQVLAVTVENGCMLVH